jgi:WD40 repeat protein
MMKKPKKKIAKKVTLIRNADTFIISSKIEKVIRQPDNLSVRNFDEKNEQPEVFIVKKDKGVRLKGRREFIASSLLAGSAIPISLGILSGCKKDKDNDENVVKKSIFSITTNYWYASFQFSPDGKTLASYGSAESTVNLWSIPAGNHLKALENTEKYKGIKSAEFSPDGTLLAVNTYSQINIWSIPDGILLKTLEEDGQAGSLYQVRQFAFTPDSKTLAYSKGPVTSIKICSLPDGILLKTIDSVDNIWSNFQLSPDGKTISSINNQTIKIRSFPDGILLNTIAAALDDSAAYFKFSASGKIIATRNYGTIKLWSFPEGTLLKTIVSDVSWAHFQFSHDGKILYSWGSDETISLWSLPDGNLLKSVKMTPRQATNSYLIPFSPDDTIFERSLEADTINLWSLNDGAWKKIIIDKDDSSILGRGIQFSPDGKILASSRGSIISLWSIPDCTPIQAGPCVCDRVCTCDTVSSGNTEDVCTCNSVSSCTCNSVCTCNTVAVCTCDGHSSNSYWFPN